MNRKNINFLFLIVILFFFISGFIYLNRDPAEYRTWSLFDNEVSGRLVSGLALPRKSIRLAFIGDQLASSNSRNVLRLIKKQNTDLVVHMGDFDYGDDPERWMRMIDSELGEDYPYLPTIGNHDLEAWDGYQEEILERLENTPSIKCDGDVGVAAECEFKGIKILTLAPGIIDRKGGYDDFIEEEFENDDAVWKICAWHKNQTKMQTGRKTNDVGWGPYEECREQGAIVATAHEHAYSRTHLLSDFSKQEISDDDDDYVLRKGVSFAFVSGLGGNSIRESNPDVKNQNWWASVYTKDQNADFGALFCDFEIPIDGLPSHGICKFINVSDEVIDEFKLSVN